MEDNGGFIAVSKNLIAAIGLNEAIVFSELVSKYNYYEKENMLNNGYMYCTYDDLRISTGLSQTAQTNAIKNLEKLNLIKCTIAGFPKKRYITVLDSELSKYLQQGKENKEKLKANIRRNQYIDINKMDINTMENNTIDNNTIDNNISVYRNQYNDVSNQFIDINKMDINKMDINNMDNNTMENNMQYIENDMQYIDIDMPLYRNQYRIINNNNNKINNNKEIIKEINKNNNLISDTKEESNSLLDTKEKNINNYSLVIQKDSIIDYYFEKYNDTYNRTHDKIDKEKIYSKIDNFSLSYNIDSGTWIELIDYHFSLSNIETNGSIDNFLNDNIIKKYLDSINNDSLVSKEEKNDNIPLVLDSYYEDEIKYSGVDNNIKDILQYFVNKYFDFYGCKYSEKETFYTNDIKKYAKLIYSFSDDFGIEATLDCWEKKIDVFFTLDNYNKTLDTFLTFDVINHIVNSEYYEVQEYDDVELPF